MWFRKKPLVIQATQWFKNGDHPEDNTVLIPADQPPFAFKSEGKVVRYYRHPNVPGTKNCEHCNLTMHDHGWIDTKEGGHIVCPSDWIITGIIGEYYPCKDAIFKKSYEPADAP